MVHGPSMAHGPCIVHGPWASFFWKKGAPGRRSVRFVSVLIETSSVHGLACFLDVLKWFWRFLGWVCGW